jgi:hypothetical protein
MSPEGGEFSLRIMVNIRDSTSDTGSVYVGCEGSVDVDAVRDFIVSVNAATERLGLRARDG